MDKDYGTKASDSFGKGLVGDRLIVQGKNQFKQKSTGKVEG